MRFWITVIAGASVLALGARAGAAQEGRRGPPIQSNFFERLDADKDGKVALDEIPEGAPEHVKAMLKRADRDDDKILTKDELGAAMAEMRTGRAGPEGSGDRPSPGRSGPPWSGRGDRGPDGERGPPRGPHGPGFGGPSGGPGGPFAGRPGPAPEGRFEGRPGPGPGSRPSFERSRGSRGESFISRIDKNEDGKLDKEEASGRMKEHFDKIDADKDGKIDREEGRRAMIAMMKMRQQGLGRPGGPPSFGRDAKAGAGKPGFEPGHPMMWHRGPAGGPQMGPGMRGPGGSHFGRSPMSYGPQGPKMWHGGPGHGPQMGPGMRGPGAPHFGRSPMSHGPRGPKMSHRGPGHGPQMGPGMRGPGGPHFGRSPMSHGPRGPKMSHRGHDRGSRMEHGHRSSERSDKDAKKPTRSKRPVEKKAKSDAKPEAEK